MSLLDENGQHVGGECISLLDENGQKMSKHAVLGAL
jgi:hypothetical protein